MALHAQTRVKNRIGFHYYPDTQHYRVRDLHTWVPRLHTLGASWLTLIAPPDRAIPEKFLTGLINNDIEPLLHIHLSFDHAPDLDNLKLLFNAYAEWGVRYLVLFDRPNLRKSWPLSRWTQIDLVESFLDLYLPAAELASESGLSPVFPPLEPGGDYWDTAFLRAALGSIQRRGHQKLADELVIGAYALARDHSLDWGAGGPERWPGAKPYQDSSSQQDQRGFYIFDWYQAIASAVLKRPAQILLLGAGYRIAQDIHHAGFEQELILHARHNLTLASLVETDSLELNSKELQIDPVSPHVLACNFWLLAASSTSMYARDAWFHPDGSTLPVVGAIRQWQSSRSDGDFLAAPNERVASTHYVLLPLLGGDPSEWELIKPYILQGDSTYGFSVEEASKAARVTVLGAVDTFSESTFEWLKKHDCIVERVIPNGTSIAPYYETLEKYP